MATAISIDNQIIHYLPHLTSRQKKTVLTVVKTLAEDEPDVWDEMPDEIKESVLIGLKESMEGKGTPHEQVMKNHKKWLRK